MFKKANRARDAFTFSLGGLRTIASFTFTPATANDRFNRLPETHDRKSRTWAPGDSEAALDNR